MAYPEKVQQARRLAILCALYFAPSYCMNRRALRDQLEQTGYVMSIDVLAVELAWLAETGLASLIELDVVRLTDRGADAALGRSDVPGVRKPSPGEVRNGA